MSRNHLGRVIAVLVLACLVVGCGRRDNRATPQSGVNLLPATYVDSLYTAYVNTEGNRQLSNANSLLAALYDNETTDSLIQFPSGQDHRLVDATIHYWMGEYCFANSRFEEAENMALFALEGAQDIHDEALEMSINSLLGANCQRQGRNEEALKYIEKCYESSSRSGNLEAQSSDLNNIAALLLTLGKPELAKAHIDKAVAVERKLGRDNVLAIRYGLASEVYDALGEHDRAERYARDAYELDSRGGREGKAAIRLSQLAKVLIAKGEKDEAVEILLQAEGPLEASGNIYSLAVVENQLGALYLERGDDARATRHFKAAYDVSRDGGNLYAQQRALQGLATSLKKSNIGEAYRYLALSGEVADSIYRLNSRKELDRVEHRYSESEALLQSQNDAYERQIQVYVLLISLAVAMLVVSLLVFMLKNKSRKQQMEKSLEKIRTSFFTNITHEFRTPLTVIMGLSDKLARDSEGNPEVKRTADAITAHGADLLELVNQLLDVSKVQSEIGTPEWRHGNVVSHLHMIAERFEQAASVAGVSLEFSPSSNVVNMDFIPQYLNKILHNLLSNSLKNTHRGDYIIISINVKEGRLQIRFADNGDGIDSESLAHIFEPYYQGESGAGKVGTGLGLALVGQMVKAMDGEIDVKSAPGVGTLFTIWLPMEHEGVVRALDESDRPDGDAMLEHRLAAHEEAHPSDPEFDLRDLCDFDRKPVALVVEDHPDVASYIGAVLESQYSVYYARNGREGLDRVHELMPDIVVTDLMMPEMDGLTMVKHMRADSSVNHLPVLVITAKADDADKLLALESGVDAYLVKPFNPDELRVRANQLISQRNLLSEKYRQAVMDEALGDEEIDVEDRQFMSNVVSVVYGLIGKGIQTDLDTVGRCLGMSGRTFGRKIQALTDYTPLLLINKIKLSKAKALMEKDSKMSLAKVASQCGFESLNYFSRIFKQIEGVSPSAYRKEVK